MRPAQQRAAVAYVHEQFSVSQRRGCRLVGSARSTIRYQSRRGTDPALRARLRDLAAQRPRFGYRRLHVLLRREGIVVNHKRVERVYREEGLAVRRRTRKSLTPHPTRAPSFTPTSQRAVGARFPAGCAGFRAQTAGAQRHRRL